MSEPSQKIAYSTEVESFLDILFKGQEGFVYVPTKNPATGHWQTYFFSWPEQRSDIVTHVMDATREKEAYVAPSLFKKTQATKGSWKGTSFVWVEFDGNAPDDLPDGIPNPTIRIQSSTKGHEHWYWRLDNFETDKNVIEGLSKQLAYTLESDRSGWDAVQVLRPPGTLHHDTKRRVRLLKSDSTKHSIADFVNLVQPPEEVVINTSITTLPDLQDIISKYKWPTDARDLFKKVKQPVGSRSEAMMRMAYHCVEMGMTDEESYVILMNCDDRWGKYKNRSAENRSKVFLDQITKARQKKGIQAEKRLDEIRRMVPLRELMALDFTNVGWWFEGLFAETTLGFVSGDPGVGKSTFTMQMCMNVCIGKDFLIWENLKKQITKVGFFSFEMDAFQLQLFFADMLQEYEEPQREIIMDNLFIDHYGSNYFLDTKKAQQAIIDFIDQHEMKFIVFDSLRAVTGLDDRRIEEFIDFVDKDLRIARGCSVWVVHHNRKATKGEQKEEQSLADLYGSTSIGASAATVVGLEKKANYKVKVNSLKMRLVKEFEPFKVRFTDHRTFNVETGPVADDEAPEKSSGKEAYINAATSNGIDI
jgi:replicative DNA helicase